MIYDSENLLKVIVKSSVKTEKRLMVYIWATREDYDRREIRDVGWVRSEHNVADGLTKFAKGQTLVLFFVYCTAGDGGLTMGTEDVLQAI